MSRDVNMFFALWPRRAYDGWWYGRSHYRWVWLDYVYDAGWGKYVTKEQWNRS